ncbi:MAG: RNA polymerase subunit sigma [Verrucomicrobia bacterium]|nr:MAG: RNA polymerase subunit sigma [Verrucomicrobiota bacterium]
MKSNLRKIRGHRIKTPKLTSGQRRGWVRRQLKRAEGRLETQRARKPGTRGRGRPPGKRIPELEAELVNMPAVVEAPVLPTIVEEQRAPEPQHVQTAHTEAPSGPLQLYLREIGEVKLLTPQEEIKLAARIKRGDKAARELMIKANLRLVVKIARDYDGLGLPLLDLINEGNIGLMKGVERFDPAKGAKLSTYASWWIKQAIKRALANQSKTIRLPIHVVDKVAHIRRAEMRLREALDREPTDEEVAEEVGLKAHRVREYRDAARAPVSLEAPLGDEDDSDRVAEVVADAHAAAPFDHLIATSETELVKEVFSTLPSRERAILRMRFGLEDEEPRTLEEIGQHFGLTRERIRQIQNEALKKLRTKVEKRDRAPAPGPLAAGALAAGAIKTLAE